MQLDTRDLVYASADYLLTQLLLADTHRYFEADSVREPKIHLQLGGTSSTIRYKEIKPQRSGHIDFEFSFLYPFPGHKTLTY